MESRAIPNQSEVTEGVPYSFEDYFPNIDKHFRFTSVPLEDHFITTGADITSIKKAEEGLRRSEAVYRSIATNFPNGAVYASRTLAGGSGHLGVP
jgi:PAS domain-containing protein